MASTFFRRSAPRSSGAGVTVTTCFSHICNSFKDLPPLATTISYLSPQPFSTRSSTLKDIPGEEYCSITTGDSLTSECSSLSVAFTLRFLVSQGTHALPSMNKNPLQKSGPGGPLEAKKVDEGLFVRLDVAGIQKEGLRVWAEESKVYVVGDGRVTETEEHDRKYSATIELCPNGGYKTKEIKANIKNGILRMVIPKSDVIYL